MSAYPITKCPKCGHEVFYIKQSAKGILNYRFNLDGTEAKNGDIHESLNYVNISKFAYCDFCDKKLFDYEKWEREKDGN